MIKCEVIIDFTLQKFDELKNIKRKGKEEKGKLFVGDTFECNKEMAEYLTGKNKNNSIVVRVIEVIPEEKKEEKQEIKEPVKEEAKRKTTRRKRRI